MNISENQNEITGNIKLIFVECTEHDVAASCDLCALTNHPDCWDIPCSSRKRNDGKNGYFKAKIVNNKK